MDSNTQIVLLTRGRTERQVTLSSLPPSFRKLVNIFCHPGELNAHYKNWGNEVKPIQEYSTNLKNQSEVRDYIINSLGAKNIIFLDDNINFHSRHKPPTARHIKSSCITLSKKYYNDTEINELFKRLFGFLSSKLNAGYGMTGLSFRPLNRASTQLQRENERIFGIWGLNVEKYRKINVRFSDFELKEDFAVNLGLLQKGYKNIVSYEFAFDKAGGANSPGGCSTFRTKENSDASAFKLLKKFPEFVRLNYKSAKNWKGDFYNKEKMLDVIVNWKKAYSSAKNN